MAILEKIDSNSVGLRVAVEQSIGVLPGSPVWRAVQANTYDNFGGEISTVARDPINDGRQREKGVVSDLDASGGFNVDWTQVSLTDPELLQAYFFADFRPKTEFGGSGEITGIDGAAEQYQAASGLDAYQIGNLVFATGNNVVANNGLKRVTASAATLLTVAEDLTNETPPAASKLVEVGHQFDTGELSVDASGSLPVLNTNAAAATGVLTLTANVANSDTVTLGTQTYTFQTTLVDSANNVLIGATASDSIDNLIAAINGAAGAGTTYGTGTLVNADASAAAGAGDTMDATAKVPGTVGNSIATTDSSTNASWGAATLTGGTGTAFTTLGYIPGEVLHLGGDAAATRFDQAADVGYVRVFSVTDTVLTLDKTQATFVTDAGTGKTIRLFHGRVIKNEADPTLQVRRTLQLERTLGAPDTAQPTQIQAEYLVGGVANQVTFNFNTADKVNADLTVVAIDNEQRTATEGLKSGSRPTVARSDAYNTTNDYSRVKMSILDPVNSNPSRLFAFVTEYTLVINNNATVNKAISKLGGFEVTVGQFNVEGTATAYFSQVEAVQAIRNNEDVTFDFSLVRGPAGAKTGISVDVPLIALGDGRLNVEKDQPITLPLNTPAAADRNFNHTLLMVFFDFLPDIADQEVC